MSRFPDRSRADVKALIERWAESTRKKDLDAIMACYAPDVRAFDAIGPLQFRDAAAYREHYATCLTYMPGETLFEVHQLEIEAEGDLAFASYLGRCGCTDEKGELQAGWMRATICCKKLEGEWRIAHEHYSNPFDPESGQTRLDLEP